MKIKFVDMLIQRYNNKHFEIILLGKHQTKHLMARSTYSEATTREENNSSLQEFWYSGAMPLNLIIADYIPENI